MKITKSTEQINYYKNLKEKANEGCYVCPGCGATGIRDFGRLRELNESITHTRRVRKKFLGGYYRVDEYKCEVCGCCWESEEYPIERGVI